MNLQQRHQRLGRQSSWSASFRDTLLLVIGLPLILGLVGMLVVRREMPPGQAAAQQLRQARRAALTATRSERLPSDGREHKAQQVRTRSAATEDQARRETVELTNQQSGQTRRVRRTEW